MPLPEDWNDLDRAIWQSRKSTALTPAVFRMLLATEIGVLMPAAEHFEGEALKIENGVPFPFCLFENADGQYVVAFTSGAREEEGLAAGKLEPEQFLSAVVPGRELCEIIGAMGFYLVVNKGCRTGELSLNADLLRDLANGTALQASAAELETGSVRLYTIDPADYPTAVVQAAFEKMRQHSAFRAAWMLAQETEHGPVHCVAVLMNPESEQLRHELDLVVQLARPETAMEVNVMMIPADDAENVAGAFRQFPQTFYLAPGFNPKKPLD